MSQFLVIVVTAIYALVCLDNLTKGNSGLALMFFGYSVANLGVLKLAV